MTTNELPRYRRSGHVTWRTPRVLCSVTVVVGLVSVPVGPASAQFTAGSTSAAQALQAASVTAPTNLTVTAPTGTCASGDTVQFTLSWSASAARDADNDYLVGSYDIYRGVNGASAAQVATLSGSPPATSYTDTVTCTGNGATSMTVAYQVQAATAPAGGFRSAYAAASVAISVNNGFPSGYRTLVVDNDNLCLDSYGFTSNPGAIIDQWACNGQTNQEFQFVPVSGGYGELQLESSGQDVTAIAEHPYNDKAQGVPDIAQEPVSGRASSLWLPEVQSDGSWQFVNENSGLCLDVYGAGYNQGQQLDQWPCKNLPGTNQDFKA
jgi:hypothetical protein